MTVFPTIPTTKPPPVRMSKPNRRRFCGIPARIHKRIWKGAIISAIFVFVPLPTSARKALRNFLCGICQHSAYHAFVSVCMTQTCINILIIGIHHSRMSVPFKIAYARKVSFIGYKLYVIKENKSAVNMNGCS